MTEVKESNRIIEGMNFFRVRRSSGTKGGSNYYHHADVVCKDRETLEYLIDNEIIHNWRRIDKFDKSDKDYKEYQVLGELESYHLTNFRTYILE